MIKKIGLSLFLVLVALVGLGCSNVLEVENTGDTGEKSRLIVSLGQMGRLVSPETLTNDTITSFVLSGKKAGAADFDPIREWTSEEEGSSAYSQMISDTEILVDSGSWTFQLEAKKDGKLVAIATQELEVKAKETTTLDFGTMSYNPTGDGTVAISLSWPKEEKVTKVVAGLYNSEDELLVVATQKEFTVAENTISTADSKSTISYTATDIPVGNYRFKAQVYQGEKVIATYTELVQVAGNLTSSASRELKNLNTLYKVTLDLGGNGELNESFPETYNGSVQTINLPTKEQITSKEGFVFANWYKEGDTEKTAVTEIGSLTEDVTYVAQWQVARVTFSLEGAVDVGTKVELSTSTGEATIEYKLTGDTVWKPYDSNTGITINADTTITAKATKDKMLPSAENSASYTLKEYTVTFNTDGGSDVDPEPVESGKTATEPAEPTREGYVFGGWYRDEEFTNKYEFTTPVTGSFTLYAKWVERIEVTAYNVSSIIAGLPGDGSYILVATGRWSAENLSTLKTALNKKPTAKVNLDLSGVEGLETIGQWAFQGCSSLTSITIPASVKTIGQWAFEGCSSLESISIQDSVTSIGSFAFSGCSSLKSITIPASVKTIVRYAFSGCSGLTSIDLSKATGLTEIGEAAFQDCSGLTSIDIPEGVTNIGAGAFEGCSSLNISVSEKNMEYSLVNGMLLNKEQTILIAYPSAKGDVTSLPTSVTTIMRAAFKGCDSLTSISIPSSVTSIEDEAFYSCSGLTSISIPSSVTSIGGYAFSFCSGLTSIDLSKATGLTEIGEAAFYDCDSLTSIDLSKATGLTEIGESAFYYCDSLTSITIPASVTIIGEWAFYGCSSLTSITIPASVTIIGERAFHECSSLEEVTMEANTPPTLGLNGFGDRSESNDFKILVPSGSEINYKEESDKTESNWNQYKNNLPAIGQTR